MKRVLIIGAGAVARRHASALSRIEGVSIVGVCDLRQERAEALAADLATVAYTDLAQSVEQSRPDYVVLLTPRDFREPVVELCVQHQLPIFMEKPPCHHLSVGKRILAKLEEAKLVHSVGFMHRWHQALNTALARMRDQYLSTIKISFKSNFATAPVWQDYPAPYLVERSGGLVGDQGIHYLDIVRYITRSEVQRVTAVGANQVLPRSETVTSCDVACWILEMESGAMVSHSHTWDAPDWQCQIELGYSTGAIMVDMFANSARGSINGEPFEYQGQVNEFELEHRGFLAAVEAMDMSLVRLPYADALKSFCLAEEINRLIYEEKSA